MDHARDHLPAKRHSDQPSQHVRTLQVQRSEDTDGTTVARGGQPYLSGNLLGKPCDGDNMLCADLERALQVLRPNKSRTRDADWAAEESQHTG